MSNRGTLSTSLKSNSRIISEAASSIPLFWLSFLSVEDLNNSDSPGEWELPRKQVIDRGTSQLPLFVEAFSNIANLEETLTSFVDLLRNKKNKTIAISLDESWVDPTGYDVSPLEVALQAIDAGKQKGPFTIPGRKGGKSKNPLTGEDCMIPKEKKKSCKSLADLLLAVCMVAPNDLKSKDEQFVSEFFVGYIWE